MSKVLKSTATSCRYNSGGSWASGANGMYIGNNSDGSTVNVGQWTMSSTGLSASDISKITLYVYRSAVEATSSVNLYAGCSSSSSDYLEWQSTGVPITMSSGYGWKSFDVSGLKSYIGSYKSTWYLLIGNPKTNKTWCHVAGSDYMLYLEIEYSDGSKIYLASGNTLIPYELYRAENGSLVKYNIYRGENGTLVKY